jgi:ferredoxin
MRRIDFNGEEYLIHTRSGMKVIDTLREHGIATDCDCNAKGDTDAHCIVKWPKDTAFLLTSPTPKEYAVLGEEKVAKGFRLACEAMFK